MTNNKTRRKPYAREILAIGILVSLILVMIAYILAIPTLHNQIHTHKYETAVQANVASERQLATTLTAELNSAGVEAKNAYVVFNHKDKPVGFICQIDEKYEGFSFKEVNLANPIQFDTNEWAFVNPA